MKPILEMRETVASVKNGELAASVAQQPEKIGAAGVDAAIKVAAHSRVAEFIPIELQLVTP